MAWKDGFVIEYVALPERQVKCRNCRHIVKSKRVCMKTGKAIGSKYDYPHLCKWFKQKKPDTRFDAASDRHGMHRGAAVVHDAYGKGIVESITDSKIYVTFESGRKGFSFPGVVEQGKLKRFTTSNEHSEQKKPPQPPIGKTLLKIGWKVFHKKYGYGRVTAVYKRYAEIKFYGEMEAKRFPIPASVENGMLVVKGKSTVKRKDAHALIDPAQAKSADKKQEQKPAKGKAKKAAPSKGPKLRVRDGKLVCPICGHVEEPGGGVNRCSKCKAKRDRS